MQLGFLGMWHFSLPNITSTAAQTSPRVLCQRSLDDVSLLRHFFGPAILILAEVGSQLNGSLSSQAYG